MFFFLVKTGISVNEFQMNFECNLIIQNDRKGWGDLDASRNGNSRTTSQFIFWKRKRYEKRKRKRKKHFPSIFLRFELGKWGQPNSHRLQLGHILTFLADFCCSCLIRSVKQTNKIKLQTLRYFPSIVSILLWENSSEVGLNKLQVNIFREEERWRKTVPFLSNTELSKKKKSNQKLKKE